MTLLTIHILFGTLALLIFTVPLFSKKGGTLHVKTGWIYTFAMTIVGSSALVISSWRAFLDESRTPTTQGFALFLFFIAIFTLAAISYGLTALNAKKREAPSKAIMHIGPPIFLMVMSVVTQVVGIKLGNLLLLIFPVLALASAKGQLTYWLTVPKSPMHWWYAHMTGMSTACIATVTAFLVTAVPRLWPSPLSSSPILWVLPGIIGGFFLKRATARYRAQFGDGA